MPTVAETADKVQTRLIISDAAVAADPSGTVVEDFVREAYTEVFGQVSMPRLVTAGVTAGANDTYVATIPGVRLHVLGHTQRILIPALEYSWANPTVYFSPGTVISDDSVWAWVTPIMDFTVDSDEVITTTCVHGVEWLEPAVIWRAELLALSRMARGSSTSGAPNHGAQYRSLEAGYQALLKSMQDQHERWIRDQVAAAQARIQLGDAPLFESRYATIKNRSSKGNRLLGTR
jgi:hypothetical protein